MRIPLRVIRAGFVAVADCHPVYVGLAQKAKHHAQTLGTNADESDIHLVAGRNPVPPNTPRGTVPSTIAAAAACPGTYAARPIPR